MGFDNECILNIQSLAGEYFCPVCRLLVYPNEALQSQCTHLYCKQCMTYIVSTTQACPYDGYLVTEADSKPLVESNKSLSETIGKIMVRCLFHRSGCTWQGSLVECTSHCSGCAFGSSPVVCNRCGIQIVHCQVQEHAQTCSGVQTQVQQQQAKVAPNAPATNTTTNSQAGTTNSLATAASKSVQDPNNLVNSAPQTQATVQTPEQWYQQQQQLYQQYYQQYPGYDPYQHQYQQQYTQQQQPQMQVQSQAYLQPQTQSNTPVTGQSQNQASVNPQQSTTTALPFPPQTQTQTQPASLQPVPYPPAQAHHVEPHLQHVQIPQHQQAHSQHLESQFQPQTHPQLQQPHSSQPTNPNTQHQTLHSAAQALSGYHSQPMQQPQQQMQVRAPQHYTMYMHGGSQLPSQQPVQMQNQYPQQPSQVRPGATLPKKQAALPTSSGQVPKVPPHLSGLVGPQRPLAHQTQQPMPKQFVQPQPSFAGKPPGSVQNQIHKQGSFVQQQLPVQSQFHPQGPHSFQQHSAPYHPQQENMQLHQSQNTLGRPVKANHEVQPQSYPPSAAGTKVRQLDLSGGQATANQNDVFGVKNQVQSSTEQPPVANMSEKSAAGSFQKMDKDATSGFGGNEAATKFPEFEAGNKSSSVDASTGEHIAENSELMINGRVKEGATDINKDHKDAPCISQSKDEEILDGSLPKIHHGNGEMVVQATPLGPAQHLQFPAHTQFRPVGPLHMPHTGQPSLNQARGQEIPLQQGPSQHGFKHQSGGPLGPYNQGRPVHLPMSLEQGPVVPGSSFVPGDKWFKSLPNAHVNQFPVDGDQREGDFGDHRRFPKTYHLGAEPDNSVRGPGSGMDSGSKLDLVGGMLPSMFPPPSHHLGGRAWRLDSGHDHPHFLEPDAGCRRRMDDLTGGRPSRGFGSLLGRPDLDDIDGMDPRHFGDFHEPPFFSRHFRRGEFEAPGNMRTGEHLRSGDFIHHDIPPSHLQIGERFGRHNLLPGQPAGFDEFPGQRRMREFPPARLGEPGFRSNFHLQGVESFDNSRKRMSPTTGWCRICKVDCETVEGLEMHSQTRAHQKMAMDMVAIIKQNAKKQKIHSGDRSPLEDKINSRNVQRFDGHENMC